MALAFTARFDQSSLHQTRERSSGIGVGLLEGSRRVSRRESPLMPKTIEQEQIIQLQGNTCLAFLNDQAHEVEIGFAPRQSQNNVILPRAVVARSRTPVAQLLKEDRVDPASAPLDQAGSSKGVSQPWVARPRRGHQEVAQVHSLGKAARVSDLDSVFVPLDMHRTEQPVLSMDESIGDALAKRDL